MANRVVLGELGADHLLKVSKPGFNVLGSLTKEQTSFDSRWSESALVFMSGQLALSGTGTRTVNFGTTLSYTPYTVAGLRLTSGKMYMSRCALDFLLQTDQFMWCIPSTTNILVGLTAGGSWPAGSILHYSVFRLAVGS